MSSDNNVKILSRFIKFLKYRLDYIHNNNEYCGKLVIQYGKTKRCYGDISSGSCYNCDYTGYSCRNGCGNNVQLGEPFCSKACSCSYSNF
jgi:hypothetical protein